MARSLRRELLRPPLSGSIRARVVALGLLAAIPSVGMASIIVGQDYRSRERVAIEHVARLQGSAIGQIDAAAASVTSTLALTGQRLSLVAPQSVCANLAENAHRLAGQVNGLLLLDARGRPQCGADADAELAARTIGIGAATASDPVRLHALPDGPVVAAAPAGGGRVLVGILPKNWFAAVGSDPTQSAFWLLDAHGDFIASAAEATVALPPIATLVALRRSQDETLLARSAAGVPYAYAGTRLPNGWQLIGAYRSTREHAKALRVLYTRLADLAALLLLGLAVTVLGADIAFGDPLRRLRTALLAWQGGAPFDASGLETAPTELVELTQSFARATVSLREQRDALAQASTRQELLMLEIHHRVKNNLQIVASLLNLQASRIRVPEARAEFQSARDRIRALATLHRHLYSEGEIHTINMPDFIAELCEQLFQAMGETSGDRIKLVIAAEELQLSTDQAVPLALIVTEAVTNAIKYGFPGGRTGTVAIELTQHDESLDLVISDDGVGIPPGRGETESGTRDGIGLQLIRGFSRQLGATLDVGGAPGTRYSVHMPLARAVAPRPSRAPAAV